MDELIDFILKNDKVLVKPDRETLTRSILKHIHYGTIIVLKDEKGIYAVARWDIEGEVAHVFQVVLRPDRRNQRLIRVLVMMGISKFPSVKYLKYERVYKITKFLKEK